MLHQQSISRTYRQKKKNRTEAAFYRGCVSIATWHGKQSSEESDEGADVIAGLIPGSQNAAIPKKKRGAVENSCAAELNVTLGTEHR